MTRGQVTNPHDKRLRANRNGHAGDVAPLGMPTFAIADPDEALERLQSLTPRDSAVRIDGQAWSLVKEIGLDDLPTRQITGKFHALWEEVRRRLEQTKPGRAVGYFFDHDETGKTAREAIARYAERAYGKGAVESQTFARDGGRWVYVWRGENYPKDKRARLDDARKHTNEEDFEE